MTTSTAVLLLVWIALLLFALTAPVDWKVWKNWGWVDNYDGFIHVVLFFVSGVLGFMSMKQYTWRAAMLVLTAGLIFGGATEFVQYLLPWERGARWEDFWADAAGLLLGTSAAWLVLRDDVRHQPQRAD